MRLSSIQVAGFKSFVGPLRIELPTRLTGVVGPNGMGKSNIIDAVRWVLGESSRKIRGEILEDIIFDGSDGARALDQASVELIVDNEEGRIGGEYAAYSEIKIRREVSRGAEQQSRYYINGTRARRKDVSDMFQGTGLGRGNYAIIAQGMVQGLIEAKPEEVRKYIEEAAGTSLYQERRRETENKIRCTEENLDRSNDILGEYELRLKHLERQKKQAEQYKKLRDEQRLRRDEWISLQLRASSAELEAVGQQHAAIETERTEKASKLKELEIEFEGKRKLLDENIRANSDDQANFYQWQADCQECERLQRELAEGTQRLSDARTVLQDLEREQAERAAELEKASAKREQAETQATALEQKRQEAQQQSETLREQLTSMRQERSSESARLSQLEDELSHLQETEEGSRTKAESQSQADAELQQAQARRDQCRQQLEDNAEQVRGAQRERDAQAQAYQQLQERRTQARSRLTSLEIMQRSVLAADEEAHAQALGAMQLDGTRLADQMKVDSEWEFAVELAMSENLRAVCVEALPEQSASEPVPGSTALLLLEQSAAPKADPGAPLLLHKIRSSYALDTLLGGVLGADTLEEAYELRKKLQPHQSVITKSGIWLGPNWMRVPAAESQAEGVLERQREIEELTAQVAELEESLAQSERQRDAAEQQWRDEEARRAELQQQYDQAFEAFAHVSARVQSAENQAQRKENLQQQTQEAREKLTQLQAQLETLELQWQQQDEATHALVQECAQAQQEHRQHVEVGTEAQVRLSGVEARLDAARKGWEQDETKQQAGVARMGALLGGEELSEDEQKQRLTEMRQQLDEVRVRMDQASQESDRLREEYRTLEVECTQMREQVDEVRGRLHDKDLQRQAARNACEQLEGQLREHDSNVEELLAGLPEDATVEAWEEKVTRLNTRLERMPPINAAAISEYDEVQKQAQELEKRHADIEDALQKLRDAMARIDRETRERFKRTFDEVNTHLQQVFPRIIGEGGEANLALTEQNLLSTGVEVRARPPGKRYRPMHMLSGGEQAMVAASLILSLFLLNPAPFCILDEVDAPLSDDNLRRFCEIIVEMSEDIQFLIITHNKITMEHVSQLIGVTMNEPGISRVVSVDIAQAIELAEQDAEAA